MTAAVRAVCARQCCLAGPSSGLRSATTWRTRAAIVSVNGLERRKRSPFPTIVLPCWPSARSVTVALC
jgi:hypothetical protein